MQSSYRMSRFEWLHINSEAGRNETRLLRSSLPKGTPFVSPPKLGRNAPCVCGSKLKFKKCCLRTLNREP